MNNSTLLLGAGFTHNFGTPLASGVWSSILNALKNGSKVRTLLLRNYDFEEVYQQVIESLSYSEEEKRQIKDAVDYSYQQIDKIVREQNYSNYELEKFINLFTKDKYGCGYIFTLNQDLYIERKCNSNAITTYYCPAAVSTINENFVTKEYTKQPINTDIDVDAEEKKLNKELNKNSLIYIKLHGSQNWLNKDRTLMIIGKGKQDQIEQHTLLNWYLKLFKNVLCQPCGKLLICGYSFSDEHINSIIEIAVQNYNLKIYLLTPEKPLNFAINKCPIIHSALAGHFPYKLSDLFPIPQSSREHPGVKEIKKIFFEVPENVL